MELSEKTVKKNYVYNGRIINVRCDEAELPDGRPCPREVVEHHGGVCIAPLTDDGCLLFVRQFRYPYMKVVLELPAGKLEKGEDHCEAGKRELEEEVGAVAKDFGFIGEFFPSPGYCGEIIYLYIARGLTFTHTNPDDDEYLEIEKIPLQKAVDMVLAGEIPDGKTQALVLRTAEMLRRENDR